MMRFRFSRQGPLLPVTFKTKPPHRMSDAASGAYIVRATHTSWAPEAAVQTYRRLSDTEATFRSFKSDFGLRPIYHSKDNRIEATLFHGHTGLPCRAYDSGETKTAGSTHELARPP